MSSSKQPVIRVENISKSFKIPLDKSNELKTNLFKAVLGKKSGYREFQALKDISFTVNEGDFFGIVGRNGSGKSTLLKILSQIYVPTGGKIHVRGSLMPFIELGVGFNPKLSARENVYLNGAMIGFSRKEVDEIYDEIVDFAELHDFMEEKLKNFSSGMKVRLAFSIAIRAPSDILLLDEVLAVGDKAFKEKCNDFFKTQKGKRTIVLVTHDMGAVEEFCNRAMLINDGHVVKVGDSDEIAALYNDLFMEEKKQKLQEKNKILVGKNENNSEASHELNLKKLTTKQSNKSTDVLEAGKPFTVVVEYDPPHPLDNISIDIKLINPEGIQIMNANTDQLEGEDKAIKGIRKVEYTIDNIFTDGNFRISVNIKDKTTGALLYHNSNAHMFSIQGMRWHKSSLVHPKVNIVAKT